MSVGSAGVLLKAPDDAVVTSAVSRLHAQGIPVVTLVTDLPLSWRIGYVGIDNRAAGATAAYLITRMSHELSGSVLVTLSSSFRGEEEREIGFRSTMRTLAPNRIIREVSETDGLDGSMLAAVTATSTVTPDIRAVYSIGGGNTAILNAFRQAGRTPAPFIAHDLDGDNTTLLHCGDITAVLHHDLRADLRQACQLISQAHHALPGTPRSVGFQIQVITPFNQQRRGSPYVVDFKHGKICYIFMPSQSPERSGAFYRDVFGWSLRTNGEGGLSFDDSTGQVSDTWVSDRPPASEHNLEGHIMIEELDATIAAIQAAGGTVDPADVHTEGERWAVFTDLDGNRLGIYQQPGRGS